MDLEKSKYVNKDGEHVILLKEITNSHKDTYTIANIDTGESEIEYNDKSIGIVLSNLTPANWSISDGVNAIDADKLLDQLKNKIAKADMSQVYEDVLEDKAEPVVNNMHAGLVKGMTDSAKKFYQIYDFGYLDAHGMSKVSVRVNYSDMVQDRYSLRVSNDDTPFIGVKGTDVIEYLGGSKWKFIKHSGGKKAER